MAADLSPDASSVGVIDDFEGYFTQAWYLRKQPPRQLERRLGYEIFRLDEGWWLLFALSKPLLENFEMGGYTHLSGSRIGRPVLGDDRPHVEESLRAFVGAAKFATIKKERLLELELSGYKRLAKVIPNKRGKAYPAGSGIFQCRMNKPIRCVVAAWVPPMAEYEGDYK